MEDCITSGQLEVNLAKIKRFANVELARLAKCALPFCYQVGTTTLIVGRYRVVKLNEEQWKVDSEFGTQEFYYRKHAILYCIALHTGQNRKAMQIIRQDQELNKLESDAVVFRYQYRVATNRNDEWKLSLYSTRYEETMHKIELVKEDLAEIQNLAKYLKL